MEPTESVVDLDPKKVLISPLNTRQPTVEDVAELRESIAAAGQTTPAIVRVHPTKKGHWELAAGARRKVACESLRIKLAAIVRDIPDKDFEDLILIENLQRQDPDPLQEALLIERRLAAGASPTDICARYGKTDSWLRRRVKLLALTEKARAAWATGGTFSHFTAGMMEFIATLPPDEQDGMADDRWSMSDVTSLDALLKDHRRQSCSLASAEWLSDHRTFVEGCGPGCAKNTADSLFPDPEHPCGACPDRACFNKRADLFRDAKIAEAIGERPLTDFILFSSAGYVPPLTIAATTRKALTSWEVKERYKVCKTEKPGRQIALDIGDSQNPVVAWLEPKDVKTKQALANGEPVKTNGKGEDPKDRLFGKRLAALNERLVKAIAATPVENIEGGPANIVRYVAAFGIAGTRSHCSHKSDYAKAWADSFDNKADALVPLFDGGLGKKGSRAAVLWHSVKPMLTGRLAFAKNSDLLPDWKQAEMRNIARVIGFPFATEWKKICTTDIPVPKSWGPGFDPVTLRKIQPAILEDKPGSGKTSPAKKATKKKTKPAAK